MNDWEHKLKRIKKLAKKEEIMEQRIQCNTCIYWNPDHPKLAQKNGKQGICEKKAPSIMAAPKEIISHYLSSEGKLEYLQDIYTQVVSTMTILVGMDGNYGCFEGRYGEGLSHKRNILFRKFK